MTQCIVYDETTNESQTFCSLAAAKKWMRERLKQGHMVNGQKYKIYFYNLSKYNKILVQRNNLLKQIKSIDKIIDLFNLEQDLNELFPMEVTPLDITMVFICDLYEYQGGFDDG